MLADDDDTLCIEWLERRNHLQQLLGDQSDIVGVFDLRQDDHELVAAKAADCIRLAKGSAQACSQQPQELIARRMAPRVVDFLEPSMSRNNTASGMPRRWPAAMAAVSRSFSSRRSAALSTLVLRQVRHLPRDPRVRTTSRNTMTAPPPARGGADRRRGVFDLGLPTVTPDEQAVRREADDLVQTYGQAQRVPRALPRLAIDDMKHLGDRSAHGRLAWPPGHGFRRQIEIGDVAIHVRAEHGVTDRVERHLGAFAFGGQRVIGSA